MKEIISEPNYSPAELAHVDKPVLVIMGADDPVNAPDEHAQYIANNIPNAEFGFLKGPDTMSIWTDVRNGSQRCWIFWREMDNPWLSRALPSAPIETTKTNTSAMGYRTHLQTLAPQSPIG